MCSGRSGAKSKGAPMVLLACGMCDEAGVAAFAKFECAKPKLRKRRANPNVDAQLPQTTSRRTYSDLRWLEHLVRRRSPFYRPQEILVLVEAL